jgi:hypothetical protein
MTDTDSVDPNSLAGFFRLQQRMEATLALPAGFSQGLIKEDDWSFIIKLHAFVEASITMLLVERLGGASALREPDKHVASLPVRTKLNLAFSLGLFDNVGRQFLTKFSELRNSIVHRVENVGFSLSAHVQAMTDDRRREFAAWVINSASPRSIQAVMAKPNLAMWVRAFFLTCMWKLTIDSLRIERGEGEVAESLDNLREVTEDLARLTEWLETQREEASPPPREP